MITAVFCPGTAFMSDLGKILRHKILEYFLFFAPTDRMTFEVISTPDYFKNHYTCFIHRKDGFLSAFLCGIHI